jgi:hypothetical protein
MVNFLPFIKNFCKQLALIKNRFKLVFYCIIQKIISKSLLYKIHYYFITMIRRASKKRLEDVLRSRGQGRSHGLGPVHPRQKEPDVGCRRWHGRDSSHPGSSTLRLIIVTLSKSKLQYSSSFPNI